MTSRLVKVRGVLCAVRFPDDFVVSAFTEENNDLVHFSHWVGDKLCTFEGEAYHLHEWCNANGYDYTERFVEFEEYVDFDD